MPTRPIPSQARSAPRHAAAPEHAPEAAPEPVAEPGHGGPAHAGPAHASPAHTGPAHTGPAHTGRASAGPASTGPAHADPEALDDVPPALLRRTGAVLLAGGVVGAIVALVLLVEKLSSLTDPNYVPSCSIDPVLSCGTIMRTAQASLLGFPNPVIGLLTYPVLIVAGALVLSRVPLPRWFWLGLQFGSSAGIAFIGWLIVQSLAVIHALCPYCMVAWAATIAVFWFVTVHNLAAGHLDVGGVGDVLVRRRGIVLTVIYLVVVVAVIASFPAYFGAMVGLG